MERMFIVSVVFYVLSEEHCKWTHPLYELQQTNPPPRSCDVCVADGTDVPVKSNLREAVARFLHSLREKNADSTSILVPWRTLGE